MFCLVISTSNRHVVHFKYILVLFVNCTSIKLEKKVENEDFMKVSQSYDLLINLQYQFQMVTLEH